MTFYLVFSVVNDKCVNDYDCVAVLCSWFQDADILCLFVAQVNVESCSIKSCVINEKKK